MTENPHAVAFGLALRRARVAAQMNGRELAARLDVDPRRVSEWEKGRREPLPRDAVRIEAAIDGITPGSITIHLGYLPPGAGEVHITEVEDAIIADPQLSGDDKRLLTAQVERLRQP